MENSNRLLLFLVPILILLLFLIQPLLAQVFGTEMDLYVTVRHQESRRFGHRYWLQYPFEEIPSERVPQSYRDDELQLYAVFDSADSEGLPQITDQRPDQDPYLLCHFRYEGLPKPAEEGADASPVVYLSFDLDDSLPLYQDEVIDHGSGIATLKVFRGYGLITDFNWIFME
jgi:hypothetical protein